jgi:hypothetical protein
VAYGFGPVNGQNVVVQYADFEQFREISGNFGQFRAISGNFRQFQAVGGP